VKEISKPYGVYAPTVTAFNQDESLNKDAIRAYVRFLLDCGVHGLAPMGSAGEFIALTEGERMQVMEWILEEVNGQVPVYAGTGHYSTRKTIELSCHAAKNGASGIMVMPPYLLRPPKEDILNHFRMIREEVALPVMVYNVPLLCGVELTPSEIKLLAEEDVIHAVKWSHPEVARIHDTKMMCGDDFSVFVGVDLVGFEGLAVGADGYIGGLAMIVPDLLCALFNSIHSTGNLADARERWNRLWPIVQFEYRALLSDAGQPHWLAVCREAADLQGIPVGPPRLPMRALSPELRLELRGLLSSLEKDRKAIQTALKPARS
jgi:4-hydroxy-tetrahydrodipicolinate synthase